MRAIQVVLAGLVWLGAGGGGGALSATAVQQPGDSAFAPRATRSALDSLAQRYEAVANAEDSSSDQRAKARLRAAAIRTRLATGDFQGGDRIAIVVEGAESPDAIEQQLSDTFVVGPDQQITLPAVGIVSLRGVLRSEVAGHITQHIGRIIHDPIVHVRALIRVSIVGQVARPGYYAVPFDGLVSEALMVAGGPGPLAKVDELHITRGGQPLLGGTTLQRAISQGRTLDELNLRGGDQFVVPGGKGSSFYEVVRTVSLLLTIPLTLYTLGRVF